jgi:hypothetical protein
MTFQHPDFQRSYESALALNICVETDAERSVFALIANYQAFRL